MPRRRDRARRNRRGKRQGKQGQYTTGIGGGGANPYQPTDTMLIPRNMFDGPYLEKVTYRQFISARGNNYGFLNVSWVTTGSPSTTDIIFVSDQLQYQQVSRLFEEMWIVGLEVVCIANPVVKAGTTIYHGHPYLEVGSDLDQDITSWNSDPSQAKDFSVHNLSGPKTFRYPVQKWLANQKLKYVPVDGIPAGQPSYPNCRASTCFNWLLPGVTAAGAERMGEIIISWYVQFNRRRR